MEKKVFYIAFNILFSLFTVLLSGLLSNSFSLNIVQSGSFILDLEESGNFGNKYCMELKDDGDDMDGQLLQNRGFETGSLSPWYTNAWTISTSSPHSGSYCAYDVGNYWIRQDLAGFRVHDITAINLWERHPEAQISAVDLMYNDGSYTENLIWLTTSWKMFDVVSWLVAGKILNGLRIWGYSGGGPGADESFIDDLAIVANFGLSNVVDFFEIYAFDRSALVQWSTVSEENLIGFTVLRFNEDTGCYEKVSKKLIQAHFGSPEGYSYHLFDQNLTNRITYWYTLRLLFNDGISEDLDPVSVVPGSFFLSTNPADRN